MSTSLISYSFLISFYVVIRMSWSVCYTIQRNVRLRIGNEMSGAVSSLMHACENNKSLRLCVSLYTVTLGRYETFSLLLCVDLLIRFLKF